jgi:hypothetical protein
MGQKTIMRRMIPRHMPNERRTVFLLHASAASLQELLIVAEAMHHDHRYRPVLILVDASFEEYVARNAPPGLDILRWYSFPRSSATEAEEAVPATPKMPNLHVARKIVALLRTIGRKAAYYAPSPLSDLAALVSGARTMHFLRQELVRVRRVFEQYRPVALLLSSDRRGGTEATFIRVAREYQCFKLVVPFAYSQAESVAMLRKNWPLCQGGSNPQILLKYLVQILYPGQVYASPSGIFLFYPPVTTLSLAAMQMLSPNPWQMGGGFSDLVGVLSDAERNHYQQMGVPKEKIVVTGQPSLDSLYQVATNGQGLVSKLSETYCLDFGRKRILCAVPQLAEHGFLSWEQHWQEITFLVSSITQTGAHILLSLHPKSDPERYLFLEKQYGVHILREPLRMVLPTAHLFVATFSSTVRWAVLLGIPSVVVDFYGMNYSMYDHLPGVLKVTNKAVLVRVLRSVLENPSYYDYLKREQQKAAPTIARFDGQATQRILDLIGERTAI